MPRVRLPAVAALAVLVLAACGTENTLRPDDTNREEVVPVLEVTPRRVDFGFPADGSDTFRTLVITNSGDGELIVGKVDVPSNFGFEVASGNVTPLSFGDTLEVAIHYRADGNPQQRQGKVYSDDPVNPILPFDLVVGEAKGVLVVDPNPIDFDVSPLGETKQLSATVYNEGNSQFDVNDLWLEGHSAYQLVAAPEMPLTLTPGASFDVLLSYTPPDPSPIHTGWLVVDSNALFTDSPVLIDGAADLNSVKGRICDPSGDDYVSGALVWVDIDVDGDGTIDTSADDFTDGNGWFEVKGIPDGDWTVHVKKGSFSTTIPVSLTGGEHYELPTQQCLGSELTFAVLPGQYDDIGSLINDIGLTYTEITPSVMKSKVQMSAYDVIFVACDAIRDSSFVDDTAVRDFIYSGGRLYASDLTLLAFNNVFRDEFWVTTGGSFSTLQLNVLDPAMLALLGSSTVTVNYESGVQTRFPDNDPDVRTEVLLELKDTGDPATVRMTYGAGTAIFTTFHTSNTATPTMERLFKEMVLSL